MIRPMKYVPALDGIRAIAIIAVFVFHISPSWIPGGFTGVDVFFVLSGFLITTKILGDLHRGDFSFKTFYFNRAKRLLPNATVMTLVVHMASGRCSVRQTSMYCYT